MNNNCPNCGKGYNLRPDHVGRRINCKNCNAALIVEPSGLQLESTATAPPDVPGGMAPPPPGPGMDFDDDLGGRPAPRRRAAFGRGFNPNELMGSIPGWLDVSLFFFGVGLVLVLVFTLFPVMDHYKVRSWDSEIILGQKLHDKKAADLKGEALDEENKRWNKERKDFEERRERASASADQWRYWYSYGILFGFIVLAISSLIFLRSESRIRRVVGAIVAVAQTLLMFAMFASQSWR